MTGPLPWRNWYAPPRGSQWLDHVGSAPVHGFAKFDTKEEAEITAASEMALLGQSVRYLGASRLIPLINECETCNGYGQVGDGGSHICPDCGGNGEGDYGEAGSKLAARAACDADLAALEKRAAELLTLNARHMLFELCEPDFAWGHPEHDYLRLDPWHDRDAKIELVDADMIEYGEPTGMDGLGGRTLTITKWGRAVSAHCLPLLLAARGATENCPSHPPREDVT